MIYYLPAPPPPHTTGCPSERAMVLAHIRKQGFLQVIRETGLRGLFSGFSSTLYRDISFNMVFFTARELFVRGYRSRYDESPDAWRRVLLGIPAGCMASVVACPFDVVKTRMQGKELGKSQLLCFQSCLIVSLIFVFNLKSSLKPCTQAGFQTGLKASCKRGLIKC